MYGRSSIRRAVAGVGIVLLFLLSTAGTVGVVDDFIENDVMPKGASIGGVSVSERPLDEARRIVAQRVKGPLLEQATVRFQKSSFKIEPSDYVSIDETGMLDDALAVKRRAPLAVRVAYKAMGTRYGTEVESKLKVDQDKIAAWIASVNRKATIPARDATRSVSRGMLRILPELTGATIDTSAAPVALATALSHGDKDLELPSRILRPKVTLANIGKTIFVTLPQRRLYLFDGGKLEKTFSVAVGQPGYPTPPGDYKIVDKVRHPSWSNPHSSWAGSMPDYIPPGPSNPLGTRALYLDAAGIRIHGTSNDGSIGTAASHGCMRMHRWDIEDLFERVPMGTKVMIRD